MQNKTLQYAYGGNTQDPPAFPIFDNDGASAFAGLSKKEYVATQLFAQMMPRFKLTDIELDKQATLAIKAAEILIKKLERVTI